MGEEIFQVAFFFLVINNDDDFEVSPTDKLEELRVNWSLNTTKLQGSALKFVDTQSYSVTSYDIKYLHLP